jgi:hypothetical protein
MIGRKIDPICHQRAKVSLSDEDPRSWTGMIVIQG